MGWKEATNKVIANQQVENIAKLLNAEVKHKIITDSYGLDKRRIEITYEDKETETPS
tara:strand:+ start:87 stop:257 length:171 start_codon:yes stop_codon:yes gene_type:complete